MCCGLGMFHSAKFHFKFFTILLHRINWSNDWTKKHTNVISHIFSVQKVQWNQIFCEKGAKTTLALSLPESLRIYTQVQNTKIKASKWNSTIRMLLNRTIYVVTRALLWCSQCSLFVIHFHILSSLPLYVHFWSVWAFVQNNFIFRHNSLWHKVKTEYLICSNLNLKGKLQVVLTVCFSHFLSGSSIYFNYPCSIIRYFFLSAPNKNWKQNEKQCSLQHFKNYSL